MASDHSIEIGPGASAISQLLRKAGQGRRISDGRSGGPISQVRQIAQESNL